LFKTPNRPKHHQVGVETEKVAAENDSAKVEAGKCAVIAAEVAEKQVRTA
jgi:hypothetical protein